MFHKRSVTIEMKISNNRIGINNLLEMNRMNDFPILRSEENNRMGPRCESACRKRGHCVTDVSFESLS